MTARSKRILTGGAVLVLVLVMVHVLSQYDLLGRGETQLPDTFKYDDADTRVIPPELLLYREVRAVPTGIEKMRDFAVGPKGNWYVAGDGVVRVLDPNGSLVREFAAGGAPRCIEISDDGETIVAGVGANVVLFNADGTVRARWPEIRKGGVICGIDIDKDSNSIYVAEYIARRVYRYDLAGKRITVLGEKNPPDYPSGLKAPSATISVIVGRELVWINNPGMLRLEAHSPRGEFQHAWGHALARDKTDISAFPGCCNPVDFALLSGGRFLTVEKGKNFETVKVFQEGGVLEAVVATPDAFQPGTRPLAVDVAANGQLLVMDPVRRTIRVFQQKESQDTP
ncbi:MAG: hypothetical protein ACOCZU_02355 [Planctomycetota bacterium]